MTPDFSQFIPQLGTTGFAIWIIWKMYDSSQKRLREKDTELISEIDKRDRRNEESQRLFHVYAQKTQDNMTKHINDNTLALTRFTDSVDKNTSVTSQLGKQLYDHPPIINQIKVDGKTT